MSVIPRKKSPRAPSLPLDEALARAIKIYDRERLHPAPTEVVAQHIGYKSANNGSALSALASLRYFGLLDRPKEGQLAVSKEVEAYNFAPDEKLKRSILLNFLMRPALYNELLEKYDSGLPSDPNLKFELIQRGFAPQAAEIMLGVFKRSVDFAGYYNEVPNTVGEEPLSDSQNALSVEIDPQLCSDQSILTPSSPVAINYREAEDVGLDRIPVRLPGGRRAWLLIPEPFFNADKLRLKAQIDLLLTIEDEESTNP